jgi:hypothetical protein
VWSGSQERIATARRREYRPIGVPGAIALDVAMGLCALSPPGIAFRDILYPWIEGGQPGGGSSGDRHMLLVDRATGSSTISMRRRGTRGRCM